jgi:molybdopterin converting factor small subunit
MKVVVECYGAMREYLPDSGSRESSIEVGGDTVGDVVDALGAPRRLVFAVLVDGGRAGLDARVREGSRVTLMPPFAGGVQIEGADDAPDQDD